jgi:hypothetical protein
MWHLDMLCEQVVRGEGVRELTWAGRRQPTVTMLYVATIRRHILASLSPFPARLIGDMALLRYR